MRTDIHLFMSSSLTFATSLMWHRAAHHLQSYMLSQWPPCRLHPSLRILHPNKMDMACPSQSFFEETDLFLSCQNQDHLVHMHSISEEICLLSLPSFLLGNRVAKRVMRGLFRNFLRMNYLTFVSFALIIDENSSTHAI